MIEPGAMSEEFGRALSDASGAQLLKNTGFSRASRSVVDTLSDVLSKYVSKVCETAQEFVEHSNRTDANLVDALHALPYVGSSAERVKEFTAGRHRHRREGFRWKVEDFPVNKSHGGRRGGSMARAPVSLSGKSFDQIFEEQAEAEENGNGQAPIVEAPKHIPSFLPSFPEERTYKSTTVEEKEETDAHKEWLQAQTQNQEAAKAVISLESRVREGERRAEESREAAAAAADANDRGGHGDNFVPAQYSALLRSVGGAALAGGRSRKRRAAEAPAAGPKADKAFRASALHGHPRKLGDLDAAQIKQVLHGSGLTSSALNDSIALGSEVQVSRQARIKWQDFQRGGWGAADKGVMDLAEREKIDRAETILKFGVKAAEEDELL